MTHTIYAQLIDNVPTGTHIKYSNIPNPLPNGHRYVPVIKGVRPTFDPEIEYLQPHREYDSENDVVHYYETVEDLPLTAVKTNHLRVLQQEYDVILQTGFQIPETNIYLAMEKDDRNALTAYGTLLSNAVNMGLITDPTTETGVLGDKNQQPHTFTVEQIMGILIQYGLYYQTQWARIAAANAAIEASTTVQDVLDVEL